MANRAETALLELYANKNLGSVKSACNPCCVECHKKHKEKYDTELLKPVSAGIVGNNFDKMDKRLLIVGKVGVGDGGGDKYLYKDDNNPEHYCINIFNVTREILWPKYKSQYWSAIRRICGEIFPDLSPEEQIECIAISNLIKCNDGNNSATRITEFMRYNCIEYLDVVRREISIIQPTHIVFFTGKYYDENIKNVFDQLDIIDNVDEKGNSRWSGSGKIDTAGVFKVLRTRHPQGKLTEVVEIVSNWFKNDNLK